MTKQNDSKVLSAQEFTETSDTEKKINRMILDVLENPPEYDQFGKKRGPFMNLREAYDYVIAKNPDVLKSLDAEKHKKYVDSIRLFLVTEEFCEQGDPGSILQRKTLEIYLDRGCSFGEAFRVACLENPHLAEEYAQTIW